MTTLAESVGRENIPEPAAKLQKLSPPAEPPLLVKKLSEHATIPTRGSAKAAGYDLSRWGWAVNTLGPTLSCPTSSSRNSFVCSRLKGMDRRAVLEDLLHECRAGPGWQAPALTMSTSPCLMQALSADDAVNLRR